MGRFAAANGISELAIEERGRRIALTLVLPARADTSSSAQPDCKSVLAPSMGKFQPLGPTRLVAEAAIRRGQILGYVQLGPLLLAVRSPIDGVLTDAGPPDRTLVGYGDRLFEVVPDGEVGG